MRISVLIPVYNAQRYLDECIDSVISQDFNNFEVLLVNDGSTDGSLEICKKYAEIDSRIKVINKSNGGVTSARKAGCRCATGDYIICIDSDDFIEQGYLTEVDKIVTRYSPDFVVFPCYNYYEDGEKTFHANFLSEKMYTHNELIDVQNKYLFDRSQSGINSGLMEWSLCRKAIRRSIYISCQEQIPDKIIIGEDMLCSALVLNKSKSFYSASTAYYNYRQRSESAMHSMNIHIFERYNDTIAEMEKHQEFNRDGISVFAFQSLFLQLQLLITYSSNYNEFKNIILCSYKCKELWKYASEIKVYGLSIKHRVKIFILRYKLFGLLFLYKRLFLLFKR